MMSHRTRRILWALLAVSLSLVGAAALVTISPPPVAARPLLALTVGASYRGSEQVRFQEGDSDCGVAALEMLFDAHGVETRTLEPVRALVARRDDGLTMLEMRNLAVDHGLAADGMRMNLAALARARFPAIVSFPDHWVVVDRVTPDGTVDLRDPAIGRLRMTHARFDERWTGHVLLIGKRR